LSRAGRWIELIRRAADPGKGVGAFFVDVSGHTEGMNETTTFPVTKTDEEWRKLLTPQQYAVLRNHATEAPGSCALLQEKRAGTFSCVACGQKLFVADRKFESGTGWPSFFAPIEGSIGTTVDRSYGMTRTEVHCSNCGGHLGHVFPDGPPPTGLRYCINGVALNFEPKP
jgi:peptide-methionine (R)-S-oxide reductase